MLQVVGGVSEALLLVLDVLHLPVIGDPADAHGFHAAGLVGLHHLPHTLLRHLDDEADLQKSPGPQQAEFVNQR